VAKFTDALRGYAHLVLKRDGFVCRYCGLDGKVWLNWLYLSWDHLLPPGHEKRNCLEYIVAACRFCNECCNRRIWEIERGPGELKSPEELVAQKKPFVEAVREQYREFWKVEVGS
jgi:hypothetical protein